MESLEFKAYKPKGGRQGEVHKTVGAWHKELIARRKIEDELDRKIRGMQAWLRDCDDIFGELYESRLMTFLDREKELAERRDFSHRLAEDAWEVAKRIEEPEERERTMAELFKFFEPPF